MPTRRKKLFKLERQPTRLAPGECYLMNDIVGDGGSVPVDELDDYIYDQAILTDSIKYNDFCNRVNGTLQWIRLQFQPHALSYSHVCGSECYYNDFWEDGDIGNWTYNGNYVGCTYRQTCSKLPDTFIREFPASLLHYVKQQIIQCQASGDSYATHTFVNAGWHTSDIFGRSVIPSVPNLCARTCTCGNRHDMASAYTKHKWTISGRTHVRKFLQFALTCVTDKEGRARITDSLDVLRYVGSATSWTGYSWECHEDGLLLCDTPMDCSKITWTKRLAPVLAELRDFTDGLEEAKASFYSECVPPINPRLARLP